MPELLQPDICVIGAGSGGLSVAAAAAAFGVPVVLIEKHRMGGDCLNTGCVPSKALIAAAHRARMVRTGAALGVTAGNVAVDFGKVHAHVQGVIGAIAPNDSVERFTGLGVRVIQGEARFIDAGTVVVDERFEIRARRFVVATGSAPFVPPISGLDGAAYLTNETIFDLKKCPGHLIVIGAGPIGLELAQAFRRLGAKVTVVEAAKALAKEDAECAGIVLQRLAAEGVDLRTGRKIVSVRGGTTVEVTVETENGTETISGSHLLVATGRRPTVEGLDLDKAGIRYEDKGIVVDKSLRTTNRKVYAIGDVADGLQFTHAANYHAGLVIRNALFRLPVSVNNDLVPRVTFTDPELAHVGLDEAQAKERYNAIRILRWPFHENDRAQTERDTTGHIKIVTSRRGKILGVTIVGSQAGELIAAWVLAVTQGLNIRAMTGVVLPYPTRAAAGKRAAIDFFAPGLTSPWLRRIISLLRKFG